MVHDKEKYKSYCKQPSGSKSKTDYNDTILIYSRRYLELLRIKICSHKTTNSLLTKLSTNLL